jgi:hypothetical protein
MGWGTGSALGFLAILGYAVFLSGAIVLWTKRFEVPIWVHDEVGAVRRSLVRHAFSGSFHGLRPELAYKAVPTGFIRRLARHSRRRINCGTILLSVGLFLFFLDFLL